MSPWARRGIVTGLLIAAFLHSWSSTGRAAARSRLYGQTPAVVESSEPMCEAASGALPAPNDPSCHDLLANGLWLEWPVQTMDALQAWGTYPGHYFGGADRPTDSPIVAVINTGVDEGHPDFMNAGASGADVGEGGQLLLSLARTFLSDQMAAPSSGARDEHGEGTHLAGIVAAAADNGATAGGGMAGIAYPARLLPLKVTGANGVATHADIAQAIIYAADQGAAVILVGMAGETWSQTLQSAIDYAWERGCLLVAPAGNTGDDRPIFPAACPHVLAVTASMSDGAIAAYSSTAGAAVSAPGGDDVTGVYSTLPTYACTLRTDLTTPAYGWLAGTSQAAAHAAGAAALYAGARSLAPRTGDEGGLVWRALQQSALRPPGTTTWEARSGYGAVSLARLLMGEQPPVGSLGGIMGRVLAQGAPVIGASVTATPEAGGPAVTTTTLWPAGAFRIENIPSGRYLVTAGTGGDAGVWEGVDVLPGCDAAGIDFALGEAPASAELVATDMPAAAICGRPLGFSVTLRNTGQPTWTRGGGYRLIRLSSDHPIAENPDHVNLPAPDGPGLGGSVTLTASLMAPTRWGYYDTSWQMCQQGGVGRFGPVVSATISVTSFMDVPADHWAIGAIEAAKAAGIVSGYGDYTYHPDQPVSRDQMAVYLARAMTGGDANVPTGPAEASFPDVPADSWAFRYVEFAKERCVVTGYPDGTYQPAAAVDRGQMAVFVARATMIPSEAMSLGGYQPPATPSFSDVPPDFWSYKYVEYVDSKGIASGYPDGLYHPERVCTRDQMAVYVTRAFALPM